MRTLLLLLVPSLALATPLTMGWSGVVTDPTGAPIQGTVDLTIQLFPTAEANLAEVLFTEHFSGIPAEDGHVSVVLGAGDAVLGPAALGPDTAFVQVSVNGSALVPARRLTGSLAAFRASRVGGAGAGVYADSDGVRAEQDVFVSQMTLPVGVTMGAQHTLTVDGTTCTNRDFVVEVEHPAQTTFLDVQMSFSHCGGGCHYAYRHWAGFFDTSAGMTTVEDTVRGGANGGSWTLTRLPPTSQGMARTRLQKTRDSRYSWCGDVDVWIDSNTPVTLISQTPY